MRGSRPSPACRTPMPTALPMSTTSRPGSARAIPGWRRRSVPERPEGAGAPAPVDRSPFEYAVVRVVPRVERGEGINAGIVLMCRPRRFLGARTALDDALLVAMAPDCDPEIVRRHLAAIESVAAGQADARPIAALTP